MFNYGSYYNCFELFIGNRDVLFEVCYLLFDFKNVEYLEKKDILFEMYFLFFIMKYLFLGKREIFFVL